MALKVITAAQRLAEKRGVKALICGPSGVGKTSLLRTLDPKRVNFLDIEAGDLAVQDLPFNAHLVPDSWDDCRDIACLIGGPSAANAPGTAYSTEHFNTVVQALGTPEQVLGDADVLFVDSITAVSRLCLQWCGQHKDNITKTGERDMRGAYGMLSRELLAWLNQLQRARATNVVFLAILDETKDDFGRKSWELQIDGQKTGLALPGIVDQVITMQNLAFPDEQGTPEFMRCFVCTSPNQWGFPAKDRSGRLEQLEKPDLTALFAKVNPSEARSKAA
jgi:hypothetical protein